jgi:hypothetical protein
MDMPRAVDALDNIPPWFELPSVRIGQPSFALLVAAVESPVLLGDRMVDVAEDFCSAIEDVDEGLERREGIQCQLGDWIFGFFLVRFGRWDTTI